MDKKAMKNIETIHRGIVQLVRWLAPASCLLCRRQHIRPRAICIDCEAAFSRNQRTCHRWALPLQSSHSPVAKGLDLALTATRGLCPTCIKNPPHFFSAHAPFLMHTGIRDLIHLWKFQNRPQLTGLLAELLLGGLRTDRTDRTETLMTSTTAAHTVLVPIPTQ